MGNTPSSDENRGNDSGAKRRKLRMMNNAARSVSIIGLDNAGKSSLLSWIIASTARNQQADSNVGNFFQSSRIIEPTVGLEQFAFQKYAVSWKVWDFSGQGRYRPLWSYYYGASNGLMFVIDSRDTDRIGAVVKELQLMINHPANQRRKLPLLIFLNKTEKDDYDNSLTAQSLQRLLKLDSMLLGVVWKIQSCSGHTGAGVEEGFRWMAEQLRSIKNNL